jgi:hypothetical protein
LFLSTVCNFQKEWKLRKFIKNISLWISGKFREGRMREVDMCCDRSLIAKCFEVTEHLNQDIRDSRWIIF